MQHVDKAVTTKICKAGFLDLLEVALILFLIDVVCRLCVLFKTKSSLKFH